MTPDSESLIDHLAGLILDAIRNAEQDGYANSKAHLQKMWKCAVAIQAVARGGEPELPV